MSSLSSIRVQEYDSVEETLRTWHANANKIERENWDKLSQKDKAITYDSLDLCHKMTNHLKNKASDKTYVVTVVNGASKTIEAILIGKFLKQKISEKAPHFKIKFLVTNPKNLKLSIGLTTRVSGAGSCAVRAACSFAIESEAKKIYTDARRSSVGFYKDLGFTEAKKPEHLAIQTLVLKKDSLTAFASKN